MDELDKSQQVQLDALGEEYGRKHGAAIEFIKAQVGEGDVYENSVARAVVSSRGAWVECLALPTEFAGAAGGDIKRRFISTSTALSLIQSLAEISVVQMEKGIMHAPDSIVEMDMFMLYSPSGILDEREACVYHYKRGASPFERPRRLGVYDRNRLPLFFRARFYLTEKPEGIPYAAGSFFCLSGIGERHLLVEIPLTGPEIYDLSGTSNNLVEQ
jgi:hypothetical protein